jgi:hypothetical protein
MLDRLTLEDFVSRVGESFPVRTPEGALVHIRLASAQGAGARSPQSARDPFSLLFEGPPEPFLPQRIYEFDLGAPGSCGIFLVPVGRFDGGFRYEAVFT